MRFCLLLNLFCFLGLSFTFSSLSGSARQSCTEASIQCKTEFLLWGHGGDRWAFWLHRPRVLLKLCPRWRQSAHTACGVLAGLGAVQCVLTWGQGCWV